MFIFLKTLTVDEWILKSPLLNIYTYEEKFASRGKFWKRGNGRISMKTGFKAQSPVFSFGLNYI